MADKARATLPAIRPAEAVPHCVPSQDHSLLGRTAPALFLKDTWGNTCNLPAEVSNSPIVVVFYLGATCMACVFDLTEFDVAMPRFRERCARVWAVSDDAPEFALERIRKYGVFSSRF
jgi:peroxiredoxin